MRVEKDKFSKRSLFRESALAGLLGLHRALMRGPAGWAALLRESSLLLTFSGVA